MVAVGWPRGSRNVKTVSEDKEIARVLVPVVAPLEGSLRGMSAAVAVG